MLHRGPSNPKSIILCVEPDFIGTLMKCASTHTNHNNTVNKIRVTCLMHLCRSFCSHVSNPYLEQYLRIRIHICTIIMDNPGVIPCCYKITHTTWWNKRCMKLIRCYNFLRINFTHFHSLPHKQFSTCDSKQYCQEG